jgi:hypothetical protein
MAVVKRSRHLRYRRAVFIQSAPRASGETLEDYVTEAHNRLKNIQSRRVLLSDGSTVECRASRHRRGIGRLVHIAAYTKREPASVVPNAGADDDDAPVDTVPPPSDSEYMDGDLFLLISGNDVVACSSGLHEHKLQEYCADVFNRAGLQPRTSMFRLTPVGNVDQMEVIAREGVRQISLGASVFEASVEHLRRQTLRRRFGDGVVKALRTIFADDLGLKDIEAQENLSAELVIKFDARRKGGEIGRKRIDKLAEKLITDSVDGFKIKTFGDTTLGHDEVSLQKLVDIPVHGKSVERDATFSQLVSYFKQLDDDGHLGR